MWKKKHGNDNKDDGHPPLKIKVAKKDLIEELRRIESLEGEKEIYEERFVLLDRLARKWGYQMYNRNISWLQDEEFWSVWKEFEGWRKQRADRKYTLWSLAKSVAHLGGDTAECGVLGGASSHLICSVFRDARPDSVHCAFDSFEGLSEPKGADTPESKSVWKWEKGDLSVGLEKTRKNLDRFSGVEYYKGWIPDRFDEVKDRRFAFVHIDVDLYEPTRDTLEFFYPRMVEGGIILCDDYGSEACPGARKACDEFIAEQPERRMIHIPTSQGYVVKR